MKGDIGRKTNMTDNQCRQLAALTCAVFRTKNKEKQRKSKTVKVGNIPLLMLPGQISLVLSLLQRRDRETFNMFDIYDLKSWRLQLV